MRKTFAPSIILLALVSSSFIVHPVSSAYPSVLQALPQPSPIVYADDFSGYDQGAPPSGWIQRGTTGITPTIMEIGGTGPAYRLVNFPEVEWQYWDKWLLKEGTILSNVYTVETQMQFQNSVADRAGLTIAWNDTNWNRIDIQPNVYGDDIEFRVSYTGPNPSNPVVTTLASITINPYVNYWLKVQATDYGPGKGEVEVFWSTDHSNYTHVLHVTGLPDLTGLAGLSTAGPHMPNVYFDNYSSATQCQSTITKLNVCELQRGDILFYIGNYPPLNQTLRMIGGTYWFHSAIYLGGGEVAEATGPSPVSPVDQVSVDNLYASAWWKGEITDWAVIRPVATTEVRDQAASYAEGKANQVSPYVLYNTNFFDKESEDKFYCSQLVWKAYQMQGIDLEVNVGIMTTLFGPVVTPDDIFYSISNGKSILVQDSPTSHQNWRAVFRIFSPGHLLLTDPEGRRTGLDPVTKNILNEIPNTYYTGPDVDPESIIVLYPSLEEDNWVLTVTGTATGEYTLNSELMSKTDLYYARTVQEQTTLGQTDSYPLINTGLVPLIRQVFLPINVR